MYYFGLKKLLIIFAIIVFIVCLTLAIYSGVAVGTITEDFNFGLFLIEFIKWIAFGCFGGGVLLALADRAS